MHTVAPIMLDQTMAKYLARTPDASLTLTTGSTAERPDKGWALITYFAAGISGLTRALARNLTPLRLGIGAPGYVDTALWDGMGEEKKRELLARLAEEMPIGRVEKVEDVGGGLFVVGNRWECHGHSGEHE